MLLAPRPPAARSSARPPPLEEVRRGLDFGCDYRYDETAKGLFRLDSTIPSPDGHGSNKRTLSSDGKTTWKLQTRTLEDGSANTYAEVGGDITAEFAGYAAVRDLIDSPLSDPNARTLVAKVIEGSGAEPVRLEPVDGDPCLVVRRDEVVNRAPTRYSLWLDISRQFVLRRARIEALYPETKHWFAFNDWTIQKLGSAKIRGIDPSDNTYWYPAEATLQMHNYKDEETFGQKFSIKDLELNVPMSASSFTPVIPQGSNVRDARTGNISVHGNGPGPGLRKMIKKGTAQARETLRRMEGQGDPGVLDPPTPWASYGSWVVFFCGVAALAVALALRRKG